MGGCMRACVRVWVGGWVGAWVHVCVRACVRAFCLGPGRVFGHYAARLVTVTETLDGFVDFQGQLRPFFWCFLCSRRP